MTAAAYRLHECAQRHAIEHVERMAGAWAYQHVRPTFAGDAGAAFGLYVALGNAKRGEVAVVLWRAKIPQPAFRAFLAGAWEHDHRHVIAAAETRRRLAAMFRYAAFPLPDELPERVRVWRGTSALTVAQSRAGYSWTTSRDVACWFATRFAEANGRPLVLTADVNRSDIAAFTNARNEHEVVLTQPPADVRIDGNPDDWRRGHVRRSARGHGQVVATTR